MILHRGAMITVSVAVTCVLAVAGFWSWLGSDTGRRWVSESIVSLSDGAVEIKGLRGHPLSEMHADTILLKSEAGDAVITSAHLLWSPWRLIFMELHLSELEIEHVQMLLKPETPKAETQQTSDLFFSAVDLHVLRIGSVSLQQVDGSTVRIENIQGDALQVARNVAGTLQARVIDPEMTAQLSLQGTTANWQVNGDLNSESYGRLKLSLTGDRLKSGDGRFEVFLDDKSVSVEGQWQRNHDDVNAAGKVQLYAGSARLEGTWDLNAEIKAAVANLQVKGELKSDMLNRSLPLYFKGHWADNVLSTTTEESGHGFRLELRQENELLTGTLALNSWPSPLIDAPGHLSGKIDGNWQSGKWKLTGKIDDSDLAGVVANLQLNGEGDRNNWQLRRADARALGLKLNIRGKGGKDHFDLSGQLSGNNIGPAMKLAGFTGAGGSIRADIGLSGEYAAPQGDLSAKVLSAVLHNMTAEQLDVSGRYSAGNVTFKSSVNGLAIDGKRQIEQLNAKGDKKGDALSLSLTSSGRMQGKADVTATIGNNGLIDAGLKDVRLDYEGVTLLEAKQLLFKRNGKEIQLAKAPLKLMGAESDCEFTLGRERAFARLNVSGLSLSGAEPWLGSLPYRIGGRADLLMDLTGTVQAPQLSIHMQAPELKLGHAMFAGVADKMLVLANVSLESGYNAQRLSWKLNALAPAGGKIESSGSYGLLFMLDPWQMTLPQKRSGSGYLLAHFARLSDLQSLMPRIDPFEGSGDIEISWSMPLSVSSIKGKSTLNFASIGVPEFGLEMKGALKTNVVAGKPSVDLYLHSGDGKLAVSGPIDIDERTIPDIHFTRFPLIQLPDQQLVVSGKITASESQKVSEIKGELVVDRMHLEIPDPAPGPTADLQWIDDQLEPADKKRKPPLSKVDINLTLNGDSEIYGRGMSLKPKGKLHLGGSLSQPRLTGILDIASGKIEFRSVKLDILPGSRVVFSGDPKRPSIYIRAARKIADVTAGVIIDGPVDQLNSQLFSEPVMSNAEIFSYIATGRPLASLGQDNVSDMVTAAEFILGPGTMMQEVQGRVQQMTGLDIFELSGDTSGGKIKAGRKISSEVIVTIEQSVSREASTALTLEYLLTRSVSIFARQTINMAPMVGLRYSKEWFGSQKQGD